MIVQNNKLGSIKIKTMIFEYENYEIYRTYSNATLLIVREKLYDQWRAEKLLFSVDPFNRIEVDAQTYYYLLSNRQFQLNIVAFGSALCDRKGAVTFAFALKQMRKVTTASLYDGIYIEEFGYILPTYTGQEVSDDVVIGAYLSGGRLVHFSDGEAYSHFIDDSVLREISKITGIERKVAPTFDVSAQRGEERKFSLPGRPELEKFFNEHIIAILNEPERYAKLGISFPSSVILYGPSGCGKTYAVDRLVEYLGLPKFEINSATIASPYIHDTAKRIATVFTSAIKNAPSVVVIDEMESYLSTRSTATADTHHYEEVAEFLRQIQDAQKNKVLIIAMTNMYDKIDPAILRRGRFDNHIEVGLPSTKEILALLINITKDIALASDVDLEQVARDLAGKTLADVTFVVKEAGLISGKNGDYKITAEAIKTAMLALPKQQERRRIGFANN